MCQVKYISLFIRDINTLQMWNASGEIHDFFSRDCFGVWVSGWCYNINPYEAFRVGHKTFVPPSAMLLITVSLSFFGI